MIYFFRTFHNPQSKFLMRQFEDGRIELFTKGQVWSGHANLSDRFGEHPHDCKISKTEIQEFKLEREMKKHL
jgi:hypothetical protein